ncbi:hypothetical protein B7O87_06385 [Cylindrospermopsis raciborskii CENA303]|uniref:Uncharacterized protein n=1 Tax=Cylindrospermopsis raciborskii CENA303 TaxID=1170769 RepID=A0A1X4G8H2_9CYAN|nr:hypothetical protein [Cylindrospermopsis raciborskii]EFA74366.1 hypothetical protein CRD_00102 [Raphidiopsis brookii D9]OSO92873.1 hypothetical protein B7O87_06385 [Cylindrospermopsis raciborskii CENA303]
MNIKLDKYTPSSLASLFILLMEGGITPNQIMSGIVLLAIQNYELEGTMFSANCLHFLMKAIPVDTTATGVTEFILSLANESINIGMLLDAFAFACQKQGSRNIASLVSLTYQRLEADRVISQLINDQL